MWKDKGKTKKKLIEKFKTFTKKYHRHIAQCAYISVEQLRWLNYSILLISLTWLKIKCKTCVQLKRGKNEPWEKKQMDSHKTIYVIVLFRIAIIIIISHLIWFVCVYVCFCVRACCGSYLNWRLANKHRFSSVALWLMRKEIRYLCTTTSQLMRN